MAKVDIIWSPNHDDKFVTFGSDLSLYKVDTVKEAPLKQGVSVVKLSDETYATLQSTNTDNAFVKCLAWYPQPEPDHLLALGMANGRVVLTSFGKAGTSDPNALIGKEFMPKHARQCNQLAWNPTESTLLAEALDKYRADYSILIWDTQLKGSSDAALATDKRLSAMNTDPSCVVKPLVELGPSEATLSLSWFTHEPKSLVTGMNHKFLRIYDLRDISRPTNVAVTKAVYGLCVDPHFEHRLASFVEGHVSVWDTRNFDKPVLTLQDPRQVVKVAWSPTRSGLLGVLHRDSPLLKLYDIQNTPVGSDELEPAVIERIVQPFKSQNLSSFDWHSHHENRLLAVTQNNNIKDVRVFERIALSWSPDIYLSWVCGRQFLQGHMIKLSREANRDISFKMKRRAQRCYGLQLQLWQNGQLVGEDHHIRKLWNWLHAVRSISPVTESGAQALSPCVGAKSLLLGEEANLQSRSEYLQWQGTQGSAFREKRVFISEERSQALQLCCWTSFGDTFTLNSTISRLESEGDFERAAAVALFNLQMARAIEALNRGASSRKMQSGDMNLSVVAMALSGFTDEKNTLWQQMCSSQSGQLRNPYLAAIFQFLTTDPEHYASMLVKSNMEVIDQVAFACIYLPDKQLGEFITSMTSALIVKGNLDGILLTGLTRSGIDLLANYVDATCDVQTASLVSLQGFSSAEVATDPRVHSWIESYRELLDTWKLWHQRAEFDIFRQSCERGPGSFHTESITSQQVYINCHYCNKSIASNMLAQRNRHFMFGGTSMAHRPKVTSCPSCRKPLPRCALCLINMGTPAGSGKKSKVDQNRKLTRFPEWFTWCQTCRHGGHAQHVMEWFSGHLECPVTGCHCKCMSLDSMGHVATNTETPTSP